MAKHGVHIVDGLLNIFVKRNVLEQDKAQSFVKLFHERGQQSFVEFILEQGFVSRDDLLNALSEYYKVPAFDALGYFFEHELVRKFPKESMLRYNYIPVELDQNMLMVVTGNPDNEDLLDEIGNYVSYVPQLMVGLETDIADAVKEFYEESLTSFDMDDTMSNYDEQEFMVDQIDLED